MENTETKTQTQQEEKKNLPMITRFALTLADEFVKNDGKPITAVQKHILQGYADSISKTIANFKPAYNKSEKKYNPALTWKNIDYTKLSRAVYVNAHLGLDMWQENMLSIVPFYNKVTGRYELNLGRGYNGLKHLAETYSKDKIINIVTELIYSNDHFKPIKKDAKNPVETFEFEIVNMFDRGVLIGCFGYIEYGDNRQNKLLNMTKEEMDKRKPKYAAVEFWGGEKNIYENDKKVGTEEVAGWQPEMYLKTLIRQACNQRHIPLDPETIGDLFVEDETIEMQARDRLNMIDAEPLETQVISEEEITPTANIPVEAEETEPVEIPVETEQPKKRSREGL